MNHVGKYVDFAALGLADYLKSPYAFDVNFRNHTPAAQMERPREYDAAP